MRSQVPKKRGRPKKPKKNAQRLAKATETANAVNSTHLDGARRLNLLTLLPAIATTPYGNGNWPRDYHLNTM